MTVIIFGLYIITGMREKTKKIYTLEEVLYYTKEAWLRSKLNLIVDDKDSVGYEEWLIKEKIIKSYKKETGEVLI